MKLITFAVVLLAAMPGCLSGQQPQPEIRVPYADLDLATRDGVAALDKRIAAAAKAVCPDADGFSELSRSALTQRCIARTVRRAAPRRDWIVAAHAVRWELADRAR